VVAAFVDLDFHRVHPVVILNHPGHQCHVTVHQRFNRQPNLALDQAAHLQHARPHRLQFGVKLFGSVFDVGHVFLSGKLNKCAMLNRHC